MRPQHQIAVYWDVKCVAVVSHCNGDIALLERAMQYAHDQLGCNCFTYLGPLVAGMTNDAKRGFKELLEQGHNNGREPLFDHFWMLGEDWPDSMGSLADANELDQFLMRQPTHMDYGWQSLRIASLLWTTSIESANEELLQAEYRTLTKYDHILDPDKPPLRRILIPSVSGPLVFKDGRRTDVADEMVLDPDSIYFMAPGPLYYPEKNLNTVTPNMVVWRPEKLRVSFHTVR